MGYSFTLSESFSPCYYLFIKANLTANFLVVTNDDIFAWFYQKVKVFLLVRRTELRWKCCNKTCTLAELAFYAQASAHPFHNQLANTKTEASSFWILVSVLIKSAKVSKQTVQFFLWNSATIIADFQLVLNVAVFEYKVIQARKLLVFLCRAKLNLNLLVAYL